MLEASLMTYKTPGERLAAKMKREKLTAVAVARAIGTSPQNVRVWQAGFCQPSEKFREALERFLAGGGK